MAPVLAVGQVIGTYAIVRRIGAGGMGEIYEVSHSRLAGRYAMKVLRAEAAAASEALTRFQREAKVTSALQHPNIVHVIDFSTTEGGQPYLVMEFLDGPELAQVMKGSKPLALPRIVAYVKQIASGLMAAHQHDVVHRDLKPQNIFVLKVAGSDQDLVKIVDFGISKISAVTATITSASTVIGTAQYMSPEQALGRIEQIDARTDQFSLALIVYEMLTGETAFRGESVSSVVYQIVHEEPQALVDASGPIPPAVAAVLKRALAKDKERRFPTVKAFADAFESAATAPPEVSATTMASAPSLLDTGVRVAPPSRRRVRLGAGVAALVIAGVVVVLLLLRREPPPATDTRTTAAPSIPVPQAAPPAAAPTVVRSAPEAVPVATTTARERVKHDIVRPSRRVKPEPPKPAPAPPSAPASIPPKTNCSPNYTIDAQGDKHFKPECFLEKKPGP
jgi:tRNA A-37 threonylcarbamoyl transferase component Bud32